MVWESDDGSGQGVFARLFAPDGSTLEGEFRLNTTTAADQSAAAVALTGDGRAHRDLDQRRPGR